MVINVRRQFTRKAVILIAAFIAIIIALLTIPQTGDAHYPDVTGTKSWATSAVYNAWKDQCGAGFSWRCDHRNSGGNNVGAFGGHSWEVIYCWVDTQWTTGKMQQWCVDEEVKHGSRVGFLGESVRANGKYKHS